MVWEVVWSEKSKKQLASVEKQIARRIRDRVLDIREDPYKAVKRLRRTNLYSLRVGNYRVILNLMRGKMVIFVVSASNRGHVYDRL